MVESLKMNDNVLDKPKDERGEWAQGLGLKDITTEKADVLFRAGCLLSFDEELWGVARGAINLLQLAGADIGIEGKNEACCGGRVYDIGNTSEFTKYAENNIQAYNTYGVNKVVTSCSDCLSAFNHLYSQVNMKKNFKVLHTVEYLDEAIQAGKIKFSKKVPLKVTYHDPCHLGRYLGIFEPPRNILRNIPGLELVEMERNRKNSWCCGASAGVKQAYPDFSLWVAQERIQEAKATGATALVTACPWCERNFKDAVQHSGDDFPVYDIIELAGKAI
jgi:Fe-S oxidoreductase